MNNTCKGWDRACSIVKDDVWSQVRLNVMSHICQNVRSQVGNLLWDYDRYKVLSHNRDQVMEFIDEKLGKNSILG